MNKKAVWIAAVIGTAAGAAAGLLLAPKSGRETRRDVLQKSRQAGAATRDLAIAAGRTAASVGGRTVETALLVKEKAAAAGIQAGRAAKEAGAATCGFAVKVGDQSQQAALTITRTANRFGGKVRQVSSRLSDEVKLYRQFRKESLMRLQAAASAEIREDEITDAVLTAAAPIQSESAEPACAANEAQAAIFAEAEAEAPGEHAARLSREEAAARDLCAYI